MKLYTEKQLEESFAIGIKYAAANRPASLDEHRKYVENMIDSFTHIKLPSKMEIITASLPTKVGSSYSSEYIKGFNDGAKWVIEQIKKQADGTNQIH